MKQIFLQKGKVILENTPLPQCDDRAALVWVTHSVISVGTEVGSIEHSKKDSLFQRAAKEPTKIFKVFDIIKQKGPIETLQSLIAMQKKLDELPAVELGYSCSGVVASVGKDILDLKPGDRVACGGIGKAMHAEVVSVPRNLIVKVPENVSLKDAASATIGAIAMQGVRRADVRLGEYVAVIGMGLIGQITAQILNAAGCRVIGVDLIQDKLEISKQNGIYHTINASHYNPVKEALMYTNDKGVDATIITAASESNEIVQQAMEMTCKKGTVVVVGAVGLGLKRQPFYQKEIDFKISCSYGPGRYDELYEEKGVDYPYAYVRWTENRNMQEYLRLISESKINFSSLISKECSVEEAPRIYEELKSSDNKHLAVILTYDFDKSLITKPEQRVIHYKVEKKDMGRKIRIGVIGAGDFAKSVHLPNLKSLSNLYDIRAIASRTGANAKETAKQFGVDYATSDYQEMLKDPDIDMVLITTRHNLHAQMAIEAAQAGKAIFLEKPMALNLEELNGLEKVLNETKVPFMVGFNRRFSPFAQKIKELIKNRLNPMIIGYQMNAGFIPKEHWVHSEEGGGRNIGEACHIYDLFNFFTESEVESIAAFAIDPKTEQYSRNDNFIATIKYNDGSVCNLAYTALGTKEVSKEQMEIYVDGRIFRLDDYKKLEAFGANIKPSKIKAIQKGQYEEMVEFARCITGGNSYLIPLWQLIQATEISFEVERHLRA